MTNNIFKKVKLKNQNEITQVSKGLRSIESMAGRGDQLGQSTGSYDDDESSLYIQVPDDVSNDSDNESHENYIILSPNSGIDDSVNSTTAHIDQIAQFNNEEYNASSTKPLKFNVVDNKAFLNSALRNYSVYPKRPKTGFGSLSLRPVAQTNFNRRTLSDVQLHKSLVETRMSLLSNQLLEAKSSLSDTETSLLEKAEVLVKNGTINQDDLIGLLNGENIYINSDSLGELLDRRTQLLLYTEEMQLKYDHCVNEVGRYSLIENQLLEMTDEFKHSRIRFHHDHPVRAVKRLAINVTNLIDSSFNLGDLKIDQKTLDEIFKFFTEKGFESFGFRTDIINWLHNINDNNGKIDFSNIDTELANCADNKARLVFLLGKGVGFIPACVYIGLNNNVKSTIQWSPRGRDFKTVEFDLLPRILFYCYFFIMTQAKWPDAKVVGGNIARTKLNQNNDILDVLELFYSCSTENLTQKWVNLVDTSIMPSEFKNRFALGVAGYRLFNAFAICELDANSPQQVKDVQRVCLNIVQSGPDLNVHPSFRDTKIVTKYGSLNKALNALLATYATTESLDALIATKALYQRPAKAFIDPKIFTLDAKDFTSLKFNGF